METQFYKGKRRNALALGLLMLIAVLPSAAFAAAWTTEAVDAPKMFSNFNPRAVAIDKATNRPHIAYGGDHLYHSWFDGTVWQSETVDSSTGVGQYASIAIDANGKVHISYYDSPNAAVKYATNASGSWVSATAGSVTLPFYGFNTSIAVDSSGKAHIGYYGEYLVSSSWHRLIKYATNTSGSWVTSTIDDTTSYNGGSVSIALDSANSVHMSYTFAYYEPLYGSVQTYLKYATNASGSWVTQAADFTTSRRGYNSSIAIDSNGKVHISHYYHITDTGTGALIYTTNASGSWVISTIEPGVKYWNEVFDYASLALDLNDKVHVSYHDNFSTTNDLKYATNASGSWVTSTLDSAGSVGQYPSIAFDTNNKAHISYWDDTNNKLKYATNTSGSWVASAIESYTNVGQYTSIAKDSNGKQHIAYYDATNLNLKYATNASGAWVTEAVDSSGDVGKYASIKIDSNDKAHISYYDATNQDLKYATNIFGAWILTTVDSTGNVGVGTSIAVDSINKAHISYGAGGSIKHATNASGAWVSDLVTGAYYFQAGSSTSISVDSSDYVHIAILDVGYSALDYATNSSGTWVVGGVGPGGNGAVGGGAFPPSIALDSNGKVHISHSYYSSLGYVTNTSGSWVRTTIDSAGGTQNSSISLDANNKVHIGYYDATNGDLKYASNSSGSWLTSAIDSVGDLGNYPSIVLDSSKAHISYYDATNGDLKYASADVIPPTGSVTINSGADYTSNPFVTLTLTCSDGTTGSGCSQMQFSNDNSTWSTAEAYSATKASWQVPLVDGVKTVYSRFKDAEGNWSIVYSDTITFDTTSPTGTITINGGATGTNNATATLTLTCTDISGCAEMQFSNDNTTWSTLETYSTTKTWDMSAGDGTKTVYVKFKDNAGSTSTVKNDTIVLDTTAPAAPAITSPADASSTTNQTPAITGTAEANSAVTVYDGATTLGTATANGSGAWSYTTATLSVGAHSFTAKATDAAGNVSAASTAVNITVTDNTPPDTTITAQPATVTKSTTADFSFISTEAGSTFECKLDSGGYATCTTPKSYTGLADGSHTFYVRATDASANTDATPASYTWTVDATAPDTTITAKPSDPSKDTSASFSFNSTETGSTFECQLDTSGYSACTSPKSYTTLGAGSHTYYVRATDAAANTDATPASFTWTVDATAPSITIAAVTTPTNATGQTITGTVEAGATVSVATDTAASDGAATVTGTTWSYAITGFVAGANNITVTATDAAGNSATATSSITLDTTTTVTINAVTTPTNTTGQTITGTVEAGATVSVATDTAASDGAATVTGTTWSYAITGLVKGTNNITVTATDAVGNTATATASIYYDTFGTSPGNGNVDGTGYSITRVDGYDLIKLSIAFGSVPTDANWNPVLDLDKTGASNNKIDGSDLIILGAHFGEVTP